MQFRTTELLSPRRRDGPSGSTPNILRVYLYSKISSVAIAATSSDPYVDHSRVFCLWLIYLTGVLFRNNNTPVTDRLVSIPYA